MNTAAHLFSINTFGVTGHSTLSYKFCYLRPEAAQLLGFSEPEGLAEAGSGSYLNPSFPWHRG
jgi:hypothetical protein